MMMVVVMRLKVVKMMTLASKETGYDYDEHDSKSDENNENEDAIVIEHMKVSFPRLVWCILLR